MKIKGLIKELKILRLSLYRQKRKEKLFSNERYIFIGKIEMISKILNLIEVN